jgi:hypothetical protein
MAHVEPPRAKKDVKECASCLWDFNSQLRNKPGEVRRSLVGSFAGSIGSARFARLFSSGFKSRQPRIDMTSRRIRHHLLASIAHLVTQVCYEVGNSSQLAGAAPVACITVSTLLMIARDLPPLKARFRNSPIRQGELSAPGYIRASFPMHLQEADYHAPLFGGLVKRTRPHYVECCWPLVR